MSNKPGTLAGKTCFVIMGFGRKTDFETGRLLDLDNVYHNLIKPAVESMGLKCLRADDIVHSGAIDTPMFDQLYNADIVIADISASRPNVFYQLGIRHALRPQTTVIIGEEKTRYPFDSDHSAIMRYAYSDEFDVDECERFKRVLIDTVNFGLKHPAGESPVYTFLQLTPPVARMQKMDISNPPEKLQEDYQLAESLSSIKEAGEAALKKREYQKAESLFTQALELSDDQYIRQQLVLATFKAEQPSKKEALFRARQILHQLDPLQSNDPVTLQLLGDIELGLYFAIGDSDRLLRSRQAYEKLYALAPGYSTGITLAYIIATHAEYKVDQVEKITDIAIANRLKFEVIELCKAKLQEILTLSRLNKSVAKKDKDNYASEKFAVLCVLAEGYFAVNDIPKYKTTLNDAALEGNLHMVDDSMLQIQRWEALSHQSIQFENLRVAVEDQVSSEISGRGVASNSSKERDYIFFSYSHKDEDWLNEFKKTLFPAFTDQDIIMWDDRKIKPGQEYRSEIALALDRSKAAVLLVSRDFLASDFINKNELPPLLKSAKNNGLAILWVALEETLYDSTEIEKYQSLNNPSKPLSKYKGDALTSELVKVCKKIKDQILGSDR